MQGLVIRIVVVVAIAVLESCTPSSRHPTPSAPVPGAFKVAILLPSAVNDGGWSQSGYEGLKLIEKELGAQVAYTDKVGQLPRDRFEQLFRYYAQAGFDFIIGHGSEFEAGAEAVAKDFPRTKFAIMGGYPGNNKNLGALGFRTGELGYLLGAIAALKSETGQVAMIGGQPISDAVDAAKLFERGAKLTDPEIQVSIFWVNSWTDTDKAKKMAIETIAQGADVILAIADNGNPAIFEATSSEGVYAIGWTKDEYDRAPTSILTSGIQKVPVVLLEAAILVRQGRWEGKQYRFGLQEAAHDIAPLRGSLSPSQEAKVNAVKRDLLTNKIDAWP